MQAIEQNTVSRSKDIHLLLWSIGVIYFIVVYGLLFWCRVSKEVILYDAGISTVTLVACGYLLFNSLKFYLPHNNRVWKVLGLVLTITLISLFLSRYVLSQFIDIAQFPYFSSSIPIRVVVNFLVLLCLIITTIFWNVQEESEKNIKRKESVEKMLREAELYNLHRQLQPHFLFNSLNSIIALIDVDPALAKRMTFQLSDFLRGTLRKDEQQLVTLSEELEQLKLYLDIEKVRFGHRLSTHIDTQFTVDENHRVPAMILQPLVENAIKFGLYNITGEVTIRIDIQQDAQILIFKIHNPFEEDQFENHKGAGFGLRSIQRRLFLIYGRTDLLHHHTQDGIYTAILNIPQYD